MISFFFFFFIALFLGFLYNPKRKYMTRKALFSASSFVSYCVFLFRVSFIFFSSFLCCIDVFFFTRLVFFNYGVCQGCNRSLYYIYKHTHTYIHTHLYVYTCLFACVCCRLSFQDCNSLNCVVCKYSRRRRKEQSHWHSGRIRAFVYSIID